MHVSFLLISGHLLGDDIDLSGQLLRPPRLQLLLPRVVFS